MIGRGESQDVSVGIRYQWRSWYFFGRAYFQKSKFNCHIFLRQLKVYQLH